MLHVGIQMFALCYSDSLKQREQLLFNNFVWLFTIFVSRLAVTIVCIGKRFAHVFPLYKSYKKKLEIINHLFFIYIQLY